MSLDIVEAAAVSILSTIAERSGQSVSVEQILVLARQWISAGASLLDGQAKKAAEAAGDAAAAKIQTEAQAEAELRKP